MATRLITATSLVCISSFIAYKICQKKMENKMKRILITGSNKGIGFGIAQFILQNTKNYHIILSGRNEEKLCKAKKALIDICDSYKHRIFNLMMDVSKESQVQTASMNLQNELGSDLNLFCIVNNAAIFPELNTKQKTLDIATKTIQTNFFGAVYVIKYFGPLLQKTNARIVNISSSGAPNNVSKMSKAKKKIILNADIEMNDLTDLIDAFLNGYAEQDKMCGFDFNAYEFSKACLNSFCCLIATRMYPNVLINCCNPGLVDTEMAATYKSNNKLSIEQGIKRPIRLILGDMKGQNGKYFDGQLDECEPYCFDEDVPIRERNQRNID